MLYLNDVHMAYKDNASHDCEGGKCILRLPYVGCIICGPPPAPANSAINTSLRRGTNPCLSLSLFLICRVELKCTTSLTSDPHRLDIVLQSFLAGPAADVKRSPSMTSKQVSTLA